MKTISDFRSQPLLFTCFPDRSVDFDLDRKASIPTTWFLSEVTEINTVGLGNSGSDTTKSIERNIEIQD
jgi:hypothetical protein